MPCIDVLGAKDFRPAFIKIAHNLSDIRFGSLTDIGHKWTYRPYVPAKARHQLARIPP